MSAPQPPAAPFHPARPGQPSFCRNTHDPTPHPRLQQRGQAQGIQRAAVDRRLFRPRPGRVRRARSGRTLPHLRRERAAKGPPRRPPDRPAGAGRRLRRLRQRAGRRARRVLGALRRRAQVGRQQQREDDRRPGRPRRQVGLLLLRAGVRAPRRRHAAGHRRRPLERRDGRHAARQRRLRLRPALLHPGAGQVRRRTERRRKNALSHCGQPRALVEKLR